MTNQAGGEVFVAVIAVRDSPNQSLSEILGVFTDEETALRTARAYGPRTAEVEQFTLNVPRREARHATP